MRQIPVKIWLPIILAAAIAVGLAIYFTFPREEKAPEVIAPKETPEEEITLPEIPADWQTYLSEEHNYEVRYPPEWSLRPKNGDTASVAFFPPDKAPSIEYFGDIFIDVFANPTNLDLLDYYNKEAPVNLFANSSDQQFFEVNGLPAVKFADVLGFLPSTIVAIRKGNKIIEITDFNNSHQEDGIFDLIVSSFK